MSKLDDLPPKQKRFVEQYLLDLNATQAAIRAGYSAKSARVDGPRMLSNAAISEAIAELVEERSKRTQVAADQIIEELSKLAFVNMDDYMRVGKDGDPYVDLSAATRAHKAGLIAFECHDYKDGRGEDARDVRKVSIKINPAKFAALVKLGEHVGLFGKVDTGKGSENGIDLARIEAREQMRIEKLEEIAARYLPAPKTEKVKAKGKAEKVA
jgi:phage terminase small subunit